MENDIRGRTGKLFKLGRELGRGGFGIVYLATDLDGNEVALKLIGPISSSDEQAFERELKGAETVAHPNVLRLIDFGRHESNGRVYLFTATELCPDGAFRRTMSGYRRDPLEVDRILADFDQLLNGLSALHEKLIHRDMKPENVLVKEGVLKIGDFGLTKLVDEATATLTFKGSGSPAYMAPEVWDMKRALRATDLYAVGVMLFEAFTGRRPFESNDLNALRDEHRFKPAPRAKTLNPQIPDWVDGVIKRLLDKEPSKRYQTASDLQMALKSHSNRPPSDGIGDIVSGVRAQVDAAEAARLADERRRDEQRAESGRIRYKEEELLALFDEVVDEVNAHLPEGHISRTKHSYGRSYGLGLRQLVVRFFRPGELYSNPKVPGRMETLRKRCAVHGGYIEIQENGEDREGWNMVLVQPAEELYGSWILVDSRASALSSIRTRYSPVATQAALFADNLACHWQPAMHVWVLKDKPLERADVVSVLRMLVQADSASRHR